MTKVTAAQVRAARAAKVDLLTVLKGAVRIEVPGTKNTLVKQKDRWIIIAMHGPAWYWTNENRWEISLKDGIEDITMKFKDVIEAYKMALTIESLDDERERARREAYAKETAQ